ncbi:MAG: response regulator [Anaerolineae bacterium]|nr:response regulator [Anaerolineae bacterium]
MKKVLIVDDQPQVHELLKVTLEVGDYEVLSAGDGRQAIYLAYKEHPHVILLDIMMPDSEIDGLEVCRRLKADPVTAGIVIILLSAKGQKEDIEAGLAAGANDYITKPFSPIGLMEKIDKAAQICPPRRDGIYIQAVPRYFLGDIPPQLLY